MIARHLKTSASVDPPDPLRAINRRLTLGIIAACVLLIVFVGFLVAVNYRSQIALRESALNRFRLDMEKRAATLDYFFSERKYDLSSLALSREINAYFTNQRLGMSEAYGLKVNLFMITDLFKRALENKRVKNDPIYEHLVLLDGEGTPLVDTLAAESAPLHRAWSAVQGTIEKGPRLRIVHLQNRSLVLLTAPCSYKGKVVGTLIAQLSQKTLATHFLRVARDAALSGAGLLTEDRRLFASAVGGGSPAARFVTPAAVSRWPERGFAFETLAVDGAAHDMVVARLPIQHAHISYVAWMPSAQIVGSLKPWHLILGMIFLAVCVLVVLAAILWFAVQNLVLSTRFAESERQHVLLAAKNRQLKSEIAKRESAEKALEAQRTMRMRSDRLRSLGEMAAGIAHELNQPLVGVRGFAELMLAATDAGMPLTSEEIRHNSCRIVEQSDRMVHIINHVRLFARDAGSSETSVVDLNEIVDSGMNLLMAQFKAHGLILENDPAPHPVYVDVNPFSVEEVIFNLLSNARHSVEKRKEIESSAYKPMIRMVTRETRIRQKAAVRLQIIDNGMGISKHVADKIFDPFFTTKDPDKGTGLGLSISKSIVESFRGDIRFATTENDGSTFEILFPTCVREEDLNAVEEKPEYTHCG
jgi:signal transduction histidine kinase